MGRWRMTYLLNKGGCLLLLLFVIRIFLHQCLDEAIDDKSMQEFKSYENLKIIAIKNANVLYGYKGQAKSTRMTSSVEYKHPEMKSTISTTKDDNCYTYIKQKLEAIQGGNYKEKSFDCYDVITGSSKMEMFYKVNKGVTWNSIGSLEDVKDLTKNCSALKSKYITAGFNEEELNFPIAYSIVVHKDAQQVERLLRAIYRPQNIYCIHADLKSDAKFLGAIRNLVDCFENVFIPTKSESVLYGGISRLLADIHCQEDLIKSKVQWKYFLNIAGQAFPLKTNLEIVKVLTLYNGANDIEGTPTIKYRFTKKYRWNKQKRILKMTDQDHEPPPHNLTIVKGSAYNIMSRAFVEYLHQSKIASNLLEWSKPTYSPDEHFWATMNHLYENPQLDSPGGYLGPYSSKPWLASYSSWPSVDPCHGKKVRWLCIFGIEDVPYIVTRKELFVNKFYSDYQPASLVCLSEWIQAKSQCPLPFDDSYYKNIPFVANMTLVNIGKG